MYIRNRTWKEKREFKKRFILPTIARIETLKSQNANPNRIRALEKYLDKMYLFCYYGKKVIEEKE